MWTSREGWLSALGQWAQSPSFAAVARSARVSMAAATLLGIAAVMAEHADHATGRHVAITRARIADRVGCSPDTVTAAWRLLRVAGWAVEAQRGHGSPGTPAVGRRPSVYHLVPRREPRPIVHNPVHNPDLPPKAGSSSLSPVRNYSPSAHARPKKSPITTPARRRYRAEPRPLPVQRLAAQLTARCHGLDHGHIGAICDTITAAGIDPAHWTAHHIVEALNTDMRQRGSSWPDHINNPAAFLSSRLRRLDWRPAEPPPNDGGTAAGLNKNTAAAVQPTATLTSPQHQRITAAKAHIRATLAAAQTRRSNHPPPDSRVPRLNPLTTSSADRDESVVAVKAGHMGTAKAPNRPKRRAPTLAVGSSRVLTTRNPPPVSSAARDCAEK
jgi:hypothetical protein